MSDNGYVAIYPMKTQPEFQNALHWFCKEVDVPSTLVMDGHRAQQNLETRRFCHQVGTIMRILEQGTHLSMLRLLTGPRMQMGTSLECMMIIQCSIRCSMMLNFLMVRSVNTVLVSRLKMFMHKLIMTIILKASWMELLTIRRILMPLVKLTST